MARRAHTGVDGAAENGGFDGEVVSLRNPAWELCLRIVAHGSKAARDAAQISYDQCRAGVGPWPCLFHDGLDRHGDDVMKQA